MIIYRLEVRTGGELYILIESYKRKESAESELENLKKKYPNLLIRIKEMEVIEN